MQDTLQTLTTKINATLAQGNFYYLSNDPERALGLEGIIKPFNIVYIDQSQLSQLLKAAGVNTYCLDEQQEEEVFRSSIKLIRNAHFQKYFQETKGAVNFVQTFKISPAFEKAVTELGAKSINTKAELNRLFENKISQYQEISTLNISLPKTIITSLSHKSYAELSAELGADFVVQFDRGHTGMGTVFVSTEADYIALIAKFPQRIVKISELVVGVPYTVNAAVLKQGIVMGGLSRQITGIIELTNQAGATVGNDFSYHQDFVNGKQNLIAEITKIGEHMRSKGYLGMFGLDLLVKPDGSHVFIEINARQPASIPMFTKIQLKDNQIPLALLHLAEFLEVAYEIDIAKYNELNLLPQEFSQIFVRALKDEEVHYQVAMGYYRLQGDNAAVDRVTGQAKPNTIFLDEDRDKALLFIEPGYDVTKADTAGMIILTPMLGRKLKINDEIGRIQLQQGAFANATSLKPWITEALIAIRDYQV